MPKQLRRNSALWAAVFSLIGLGMVTVAVLGLTNILLLKEGAWLPLLIAGAINLVAAPIFLRTPRK